MRGMTTPPLPPNSGDGWRWDGDQWVNTPSVMLPPQPGPPPRPQSASLPGPPTPVSEPGPRHNRGIAWLLGAAAFIIVAAIATATLDNVDTGSISRSPQQAVPTVPPGSVFNAWPFWAA